MLASGYGPSRSWSLRRFSCRCPERPDASRRPQVLAFYSEVDDTEQTYAL